MFDSGVKIIKLLKHESFYKEGFLYFFVWCCFSYVNHQKKDKKPLLFRFFFLFLRHHFKIQFAKHEKLNSQHPFKSSFYRCFDRRCYFNRRLCKSSLWLHEMLQQRCPYGHCKIIFYPPVFYYPLVLIVLPLYVSIQLECIVFLNFEIR